MFENCLVTVGTTQFDLLIKQLDQINIIKILKLIGIKQIFLQIGTGKYEPKLIMKHINCKIFRTTPNLQQYIDKCELVISHAGAGSILETLRANRTLLVVINETLMNNHQYEVAEAMKEKDYLEWCTVNTLEHTLSRMPNLQLNQYPSPTANFGEYLNNVLFENKIV